MLSHFNEACCFGCVEHGRSAVIWGPGDFDVKPPAFTTGYVSLADLEAEIPLTSVKEQCVGFLSLSQNAFTLTECLGCIHFKDSCVRTRREEGTWTILEYNLKTTGTVKLCIN